MHDPEVNKEIYISILVIAGFITVAIVTGMLASVFISSNLIIHTILAISTATTVYNIAVYIIYLKYRGK